MALSDQDRIGSGRLAPGVQRASTPMCTLMICALFLLVLPLPCRAVPLSLVKRLELLAQRPIQTNDIWVLRTIHRGDKAWPYTVERLVKVHRGHLAILSAPTVRDDAVRVVGVTNAGEILPLLTKTTRRTMIVGWRDRYPGDTGLWYEVWLGNGITGWLFGQPERRTPFATDYPNPNYFPWSANRKKLESDPKRLARFLAGLKPVASKPRSFLISDGMEIDGAYYPPGTTLAVTDINLKTLRIVTYRGTQRAVRRDIYLGHHLAHLTTVRWDANNNRALETSSTYWEVVRFFNDLLFWHFLTIFGGTIFRPMAVFSALVAVFVAMSRYTTDDFSLSNAAPWGVIAFLITFFLSFWFFGWTIEEVQRYRRFVTHLNVFNMQLAERTTASGHILPFLGLPHLQYPSGLSDPIFFGIQYGILFLFAAIYFPGFIRTLHLIFVPHPEKQHLTTGFGAALRKEVDPEDVSRAYKESTTIRLKPAFVSRNIERKAKALRNRLRADRELMEEFIERERTKVRFQEQERKE